MKKVSIILIVLMLVSMLCSCGDDVYDEASVAIVYGAHANAMVPSVTGDIYEKIYTACFNYGDVTIITAEGKPRVVDRINIVAPDNTLSSSNRKELALAQANAISEIITENAFPLTEELDTLEALSLAARALSKSSNNTLVVIDSGLTTTGYLDFTLGLLNAEAKEIVEYLDKAKAIPNLEGVTVYWIGLGDVAAPQHELTKANRESLKAIWEAVLVAAGADPHFEDELTGVRSLSNCPYITPVPIREDQPFAVQVEADTLIKDPIILDETSILFLPDSCEFANNSLALETLKPISQLLIANPDKSVIIAGTTATVLSSDDKCVAFSLKRAETVKEGLIQLGVDAHQLHTKGLGYDNTYHIQDLDENDRLIPEYASRNRSVIIVDIDSDDGRYIQNY